MAYLFSLDIVLNDWETNDTDDNIYSKTRKVSFTLSLTHPMGPKHSQVTETQVCLMLKCLCILTENVCPFLPI